MPTRREFVQAVAAVGGSVTAAMTALELLAPATASAAPFGLRGSGNGTTVAILGGGVAGLCAAYELGKVGYDCTVLEARQRPGGRVWTVRNGDRTTELDGATQTAVFPSDAYLNPGPARVPQFHVTIDYYRELGVPIEQFGNVNLNAYYYASKAPAGQRRIRAHAAKTALRAYTDELLAKAVAHDRLDEPLTRDDRQKLEAFLVADGALDKKTFQPNNRVGEARGDAGGDAGFRVYPGAGTQAGTPEELLGLGFLVRNGFGAFLRPEYDYTQQLTMFQPVGGIDALPRAFAARLGPRVRLGAEVQAIRKTPSGVRIEYLEASGESRALAATYCICTIPLPVLRSIPADFSLGFAAAIGRVDYESSAKIGIAFKRRFWEEDDRIMSGISRTDEAISQIWYPSYDYLGKNGGVLTGAYASGKPAEMIGRLAPHEREALALRQGANIHAQYLTEFIASFSVPWQNQPYNRGAWVAWTTETRKREYPLLLQPDGPIYLAGEHMSYINAWQAGALESARYVATAIHRRVQAQ